MKRRRIARLGGLVVAALSLGALIAAPAAQAQDGGGALRVREVDSTDPKAVDVTFLWTGDPDALNGMTLREGGAQQKIDTVTALKNTETRLGTVFVVDVSGSMADDGALTAVKAGILEQAKTLPAGDEMAIVSFNDKALIESGFTTDVNQLEGAVDQLAAPRDGRSAVWDGIRLAGTLFDDRPELQPNMVLVTDGPDDASAASLSDARADLVASGAALFSVGLSHGGGADQGAIESIIARTGGLSVSEGDDVTTAQAFERIGTALRSQFVASYASGETQGSVTVSLTVGDAETSASYVAGSTARGAAIATIEPVERALGPSWLRGKAVGLGALALAGLAVGLLVFAVASLATRTDESLQAVLSPYSEGGVPGEDHDGALAQTALLQRAVEMTEDFAERQGFLVKVEALLERADLPMRAAEAMFFYAAAVVIVTVGAFFLTAPVTGLGIGVFLALIPPAALNFLAGQRGKKFQSLLPDTLQLLSGSLRAGYSLLQGIEAVSKEVGEPMGKELRRVITEARLGREVEDAMESVAERMDSPDFAWAVMAVRIQREVGGNLSELLLTVSDTMVQRERLRRDVAALTAEGKISAMILGLLPVGLGAFMWMSNAEYMAPLGATGMGQGLMGLALVSLLIGFAWMKKIISIEI